MNKIKLIMLIGAPASGKSTAAEKLAAKYDAIIISTDRLRAEVNGAEHIQKNWFKIEALLYVRIVDAIFKKNKNIILDATHYKKEYRAKIIREFSRYSEISAYYFNYPFSVIYKRNKERGRVVPFNVLKDMYKELKKAPPTLTEGFKSIKKMYVPG
tara:strand:- start:397 stop:864 length:468 start_codon:yes stop_codon:yes gene_type:complete